MKADLQDCDNFKIVIHDFTPETIEKLQVINDQFDDTFTNQVEFNFGKDFTREHILLLNETLSNVAFRAL